MDRLSFLYMLSPLAHGPTSSMFASKHCVNMNLPATRAPPPDRAPATEHEKGGFTYLCTNCFIYIYINVRVCASLAHTQHAVNWEGPGSPCPRLRLLLLSDVDLASAGRVVEWTIEK